MNANILSTIFIGVVLLVGCTLPSTPVPPTPTPLAFPTSTLFIASPTPAPLTPGAVTPPPGTTLPSPANPSSICNDPQVTALIDSFKSAVLKSDGPLLSSLVSPARGMDVAFFRDGTVITYDQEHAKFLFETTFQVDWGAEPGSVKEKIGSFHEAVVPDLVKVFNQQYTLK